MKTIETRAFLRQDVLNDLLEINGMFRKDIYRLFISRYNVDISYQSVARILANKSTWNLTHAMILSDIFHKPIEFLFEFEVK